MEKTRLAKTDLYVSPICYGTWEIGGMPFFQTPSRSESIRAIHTALDIGVNFIDTSPVYGFCRAEELVGEAISKRDVVIATKCGLYWQGDDIDSIDVDNNPQFIRKDLEGSLKRLRREQIDLYQIHWPEFSNKTPIEETIGALEDLKAEGKIRFYGVCNFSPEKLNAARLYGCISTLQNRFSLLMGGSDEITLCKDIGIAFMAYSPLHRGLLTGEFDKDFTRSDDLMVRRIGEEKDYELNRAKAQKLNEIAISHGVTLPNLVLNYMIRQVHVDIAIVGSKNPLHIQELGGVLSVDINADEIRVIL